jgi:D-alanyl-lipoteichoic acid acyltransferase DltB (MBOAT superfamily)
VIVALYFALPARWRWLFLLIASYYFYMCWKAEYAILILFTTLVDYVSGLKMGKAATKREKKLWLVLSIIANLGMLAGFKYFNFFTESLNFAFSEMNLLFTLPIYKILLPVGISFYTFQSLSYSVDVYRGVRQPERHAGKFALYVSFFPQLVAGPIERSNHLIPQIHQPRAFDQQRLVSGLKLMVWGYFKKLVIADRLGLFVSYIYENPSEHSGLPVILATILFAFQIYCDFSGYTDIARGSARILGYDLMINFNRPMVAKSLRDFWNRWHISLTTWFRDYLLYSMPYVRNRKVVYSLLYRNLIITYLLMGFWHGANWTFVIFGLLHGTLLVAETVTEKQRNWLFEKTNINKHVFLKNGIGLIATFSVVVFSLFFFRANNLNDSLMLISNSLDFSNFEASVKDIIKNYEVMFGILMVIVLLIAEYLHEKKDLVRIIAARPLIIRWSLYTGFLFFILLFGILQKQKFLYFQF